MQNVVNCTMSASYTEQAGAGCNQPVQLNSFRSIELQLHVVHAYVLSTAIQNSTGTGKVYSDTKLNRHEHEADAL